MDFSDYLDLSRIESVDSVSKKKSLVLLSEMMAKSSQIDSHTVLSRLFEREQLGSTAIGNGVAIPHCRIVGLNRPLVALLRISEGVDYEAPDNIPVKLVFALLLPEDANQEHLNLLADLATKLNNMEYVNLLLTAEDENKLLNILKGQWS